MNIRILTSDRPEQAEEFKAALAARVSELTGGGVQPNWVEDSGPPPDLVVLFGSPRAAGDPDLNQAAQEAVDSKTQILSFVDNLLAYSQTTPQAVQHLNGVEWRNAETAADLVLRSLGATEADRRVFLSYRRTECTPLALQLFDHLHRAGFTVFLDRFGIPPGADVWDTIEEALHDMSFVLLLESPDVASSKWVAEREIGYALEYDLGLMALALPDIPDPPPFASLPPDLREPLAHRDLEPDGTLTGSALTRVLPRIARRHESHLRQRRERMIADVSASLGHPVLRYGPGSLLCRIPSDPQGSVSETLIRVCPRPADYRDVVSLGRDSERRPPVPEAWIAVYPGGNQPAREIAEWIGGQRKPKVEFLSPFDIPARIAARRAARQTP